MGRRRQKAAEAARAKKTTDTPRQLTPARRTLFITITVLFPFIVLGLLEGSLRVAHYGRTTTLFEPAADLPGNYLQAGHTVAARFFPNEQFPPSPPNDVFLAEKPAHSFRIFALPLPVRRRKSSFSPRKSCRSVSFSLRTDFMEASDIA